MIPGPKSRIPRGIEASDPRNLDYFPGRGNRRSMIENYNGTWQTKVWARFQHGSLPDLQGPSQRYVTALRRHRADRIESAPRRRAFPERWRLNLQSRPRGRIMYLRRTSAAGAGGGVGRGFAGYPHSLYWVVRGGGGLDGDKGRIYQPRRGGAPGPAPLREMDPEGQK